MDDSSTGPFIIGLMFLLRCLIPLGILFGISYLLQRLGLITDRVEDDSTEQQLEQSKNPAVETSRSVNLSSKVDSASKGQNRPKKKSATPKKRSRNK